MLKQNRTTRNGGAILETTPTGPRLTVIIPTRRTALVKGRLVEAMSDVLECRVLEGATWTKARPTDNEIVSPRENLARAFPTVKRATDDWM